MVKMQWSLLVLIVMGQCSSIGGQLCDYHFIGENMTWKEAKDYCRKNHTDLATVSNQTDMQRLLNSTTEQYQGGAWIGLQDNTTNTVWRWSQPGVEFNETESEWSPRQPDNLGNQENCVRMHDDTWNDDSCTKRYKFICYDEHKKSGKTFYISNDEKTWLEAQRFCRENYTDLISGVQQLKDFKTQRQNDSNQSQNNVGQSQNNTGQSLNNVGQSQNNTGQSLNNVGQHPNNAGQPPNNAGQPPNNAGQHPNNAGQPPNNAGQPPSNAGQPPNNVGQHPNNAGQPPSNAGQPPINAGQPPSNAGQHPSNGHSQNNEGQSQNNAGPLWIGLFRDSWSWSDGSNFSFRLWDKEEPEDDDSEKTCAMTTSDGKWSSDDCNKTKPFFCYNDSVILIKENMTWVDALYYCRDHYRDLVSITNQDEQLWVQERAKMASTPYVWLGLRYTCTLDLWFWVTDEMVCYNNWGPDQPGDDCTTAGAMDREGTWVKKHDDHNQLNFICSK